MPEGVKLRGDTRENNWHGETHRKLEQRDTLKTGIGRHPENGKEISTMERRIPYNLQFFALEGDNPPGAGMEEPGSMQAQQKPGQQTATPEIDYDKLASIVQKRKSATEDTVLKSYFKEQGLSREEIEQAISSFKEQKAKNQPDIGALQKEAADATRAMQNAVLKQAATLEAVELGMDSKTIQYVLKLADFDGCMNDKGEADSEKLKTAITKVMEDVPALKPEATRNKGFQVGSNSISEQQTDQEAQLKSIFGNNK